MPNGDIFIADGYGAQYVLQYDSNGKLKHYFGGRGEGDEHLDNAHGICFDTRNELHSLLVTDRTRNCFKRFSKEGKLLEVIKLPGACVCRPVIKDDHLYAAVLRSPDHEMPAEPDLLPFSTNTIKWSAISAAVNRNTWMASCNP